MAGNRRGNARGGHDDAPDRSRAMRAAEYRRSGDFSRLRTLGFSGTAIALVMAPGVFE